VYSLKGTVPELRVEFAEAVDSGLYPENEEATERSEQHIYADSLLEKQSAYPLGHMAGEFPHRGFGEVFSFVFPPVCLQRAIDCLSDLFGHDVKRPFSGLIFRENMFLREICQHAARVQDEACRVLSHSLASPMEIVDKRINVVFLRDGWEDTVDWLAIKHNTSGTCHGYVSCEILVGLEFIVPFLPLIVRKLFLDFFAPVFAVMKVIWGRMLPRSNVVPRQNADLDR
jgi:hypothetical protein